MPNPSPRPAPAWEKVGAVQRRFGCAHYSDCLDLAAREGWESFTCLGCESFRAAPVDPVETTEMALRCLRLIRAAEEEWAREDAEAGRLDHIAGARA